jgi:hypothetical protein
MKQFCTGYIKGIMGLVILLGTQVSGTGQTGITNATYSLTVHQPYQHSTSPGTLSSTNASVTVGNLPAPFIHAQATENSSSPQDASADVYYYFEYVGAAGSLPIDISYHLAYSGDFNTFGLVESAISLTGVDGIQISNYAGGSPSQDIHGTLVDSLSANTIYELHLSALAEAPASSFGLTSTASADPVISIDPSFAGDPSSYSLELSNGVGNSLTPEPTVAVNMIVAGGLLLARRKRPAAAGDRRIK